MRSNRRFPYRSSNPYDKWTMNDDDQTSNKSEYLQQKNMYHDLMIYEPYAKSSILENFICEMVKDLYTHTIFFIFHMAQITRDGFTFTVLDEIQAKYLELIELVL